MWPAAPAGAAPSLTLQAAERERPDGARRSRLDRSRPPGAVCVADAARARVRRRRPDGDGAAAGAHGRARASARVLRRRQRACASATSTRRARHGHPLPDGRARARRAGRADDRRQHRRARRGRRAARGRPVASSSIRVSVGGTVLVRVLEASEVDLRRARRRSRTASTAACATAASPATRRCRACTASRPTSPLRIVSRNRRDPGWWRLREDCDPAISARRGERIGDGRVQPRRSSPSAWRASRSRLAEFTPAGLVTGIIRID